MQYLRRATCAVVRGVRIRGRAVRRTPVCVSAAAVAALAWVWSDSPSAAAGSDGDDSESALQALPTDLPVVSPEEVARHSSPSDAWVIISGIAYDVTSLIANHPGGAGILEKHAGRDVTREFNHLSHSERARRLLPGLAVGQLPPGYATPALHSLELPPPPVPPGAKRVLVIGAGVCGTAVAAMLAERGHAVTVVDAAPLIGGTALRSTAILFIGPTVEKLGRLRGETLTSWSGNTSFELMQALGPGVGWVERGALGVIADADVLAATAKRYAPGGPLHGTGSELVGRERMLELEPSLSPALVGATWHPRGATVDPFLVCDAYASRARAAGARFALGRRVTALARRPVVGGSGGGFTAIVERADVEEPSGGKGADPIALDADEVIIATGWLCRSLAARLGYDVPVGGTHGQLFTTKSDAVTLRHNIFSWEGPAYWNAHPDVQQATLRTDPPHERLTRHFYAVQVRRGRIESSLEPRRCGPGTWQK
jgi:glycine/D-amino acid oxidase-like deaminating enzyme